VKSSYVIAQTICKLLKPPICQRIIVTKNIPTTYHRYKKYTNNIYNNQLCPETMSDLINEATTQVTTIPEFEIVGLHHNSQGRYCTMHSHCGKHVLEGDILRLVGCVMQVSEEKEPEAAIKLVKIIDGTEACTVGFIPRAYATMEKIQKKIGTYCFVLELYDISKNKYKRRLSKRNYGVASCIFIDEVDFNNDEPIPHME
jgi:hypothetical protein